MKLTSLLISSISTKELTEKDCRTPNFCNRARRQLCASDGVTYTDECAWKQAYCGGKNKAKEMLAFGSCDEYEAGCRQKLAKCVKKYKPICGDNGVTFGNKCAMEHHNCLAKNKKVKEAYKGKKTRDQYFINLFTKGECKEMSNDVQQCIRSCDKKDKPVCGSDGKTYQNKCYLENESCSTPELVVVSKGACPEEAEEEEGGVDERLKPVECPTFCNRMLDPVCGSNYQTYGNECVLRNEHCYKDEKLTQLHTGPCECPSLCPATINLVCGSDGKTYTSACHLARSRCGGGETEAVNVEFEHWGECEQNGDLQAELVVSPEVNLKFGRPKLDNGWRPSWAPKPTTTQAPAPFCPRIWIPVCDENGKTHGHPCYPNHYGLKWEYGECKPVMVNDNVIITTTEAPETEAPAAYIPKQDCPCHRAFRPVCGSNGYTYANECLAECDNQPDFTTGSCPERSLQNDSQDIPVYDDEEEEAEEPTTCACHRMFKPVCTVSGQEFTNDCLAECAGEEVEFKCSCDVVNNGKCPDMANDIFGGFGFGFGGIVNEMENDVVEEMVVETLLIIYLIFSLQAEEETDEDLDAKCSQNCRRLPVYAKCGLINGEYKSFDNWCELDVALCLNPGRDVSETKVCGMKVSTFRCKEHFKRIFQRNGVFKVFTTGCQAEKNNASVVDMSLCDDAREFNEQAKTYRSGKGGVFQPWRFRLLG